jgi:hypothetical protein
MTRPEDGVEEFPKMPLILEEKLFFQGLAVA